MGVPHDDVKLSSSVTVRRYRALHKADDRKALGQFVRERFDERYFKPVMVSTSPHGFTLMAVGCLVIEALESFYQGRPDTKRHSGDMFRDFFRRDTPLKVFASQSNWFFKDIRCGILHQAETRNGWRIRRWGPLLDLSGRKINAERFMREVRHAVAAYSYQIQSDETCWANFQTKMQAICENCAVQEHEGANPDNS